MSIAYVGGSTQQLADNATAASLAAPGGLAIGHLLLLPLLLTVDAAGSWPTPALAGWSALTVSDNGAGAFNRLHCLWKVAEAGDVGATFAPSWGSSPTLYDSVAAVLAYSGTHPVSPVDSHDIQVNAAATTSIAKALTLGFTSQRLVCLFSGSHGSTATTGNAFAGPGGMSDRLQVAATGGEFGRLMISDEAVTGLVGASTGTRTASIGGGGSFGTQCLSILLREAPTSGPDAYLESAEYF
jgi:hypothetical protein